MALGVTLDNNCFKITFKIYIKFARLSRICLKKLFFKAFKTRGNRILKSCSLIVIIWSPFINGFLIIAYVSFIRIVFVVINKWRIIIFLIICCWWFFGFFSFCSCFIFDSSFRSWVECVFEIYFMLGIFPVTV